MVLFGDDGQDEIFLTWPAGQPPLSVPARLVPARPVAVSKRCVLLLLGDFPPKEKNAQPHAQGGMTELLTRERGVPVSGLVGFSLGA